MNRYFSYFVVILFYLFALPSFADELIIEPDAGRTPILAAIKNAKSSIGLIMYGLTDKNCIEELINAKKKGKNVQILLEPHPYKNTHENDYAIQQLQAADIHLEYPDNRFQLLHQKTFLIDQHDAIVMTFNLTRSTFSNQRNFALIITDPKMVREIHHVFSADRKHQPISVNNPNLIWSPDNSREKILDLIRNAKEEIKIYAQDLSDYQIIGALAKASRSGIKIKILLSVSSKKFKRKKFDYLKNTGITIKNSQHFIIHAKVIMIDRKRAILGSINLTEPSINNNRELSVATTDRRVMDQLLAVFEHDWEKV